MAVCTRLTLLFLARASCSTEPAPSSRRVAPQEGKGNPKNDILVEVFRDGEMCVEWTFEEIRTRAQLPAYVPSVPTVSPPFRDRRCWGIRTAVGGYAQLLGDTHSWGGGGSVPAT